MAVIPGYGRHDGNQSLAHGCRAYDGKIRAAIPLYKLLTVTGTTRASLLQFRETLNFILSGILNVKKLVSNRFPLKDIAKGFELAAEAKGLKNVIYME